MKSTVRQKTHEHLLLYSLVVLPPDRDSGLQTRKNEEKSDKGKHYIEEQQNKCDQKTRKTEQCSYWPQKYFGGIVCSPFRLLYCDFIHLLSMRNIIWQIRGIKMVFSSILGTLSHGFRLARNEQFRHFCKFQPKHSTPRRHLCIQSLGKR